MTESPEDSPRVRSTRPSWGDRASIIANVVVVVVVVFLLARSDGPIARWWAEKQAREKTEQRLQAVWPELIQGARTDTGPPGARVIVEFSDYQCPGCQQAHFQFASVARDAGIGIVLRHVPNAQAHPMAHGAAMAAICARRQGKFIEMNRRLFTAPDWQTAPMWHRLAADVGIPDSAAFDKCLVDDTVADEIARDLALGGRIGLRGTPSFVGPSGVFLGIPTKADLLRLIE